MEIFVRSDSRNSRVRTVILGGKSVCACANQPRTCANWFSSKITVLFAYRPKLKAPYHSIKLDTQERSPFFKPLLSYPPQIPLVLIPPPCCALKPFRTKTPTYLFLRGKNPLFYHQIGNTNLCLYFPYKSVKLDVLCRQIKVWTFGHPFQSKSCQFCI